MTVLAAPTVTARTACLPHRRAGLSGSDAVLIPEPYRKGATQVGGAQALTSKRAVS
jgi:hypothetical protein